MRQPALLTTKLDDATAEQVRRSHADAIGKLQDQPASSFAIVSNVTLKDAVATPIAHSLGRAPSWVSPSPPRGASSTGRIEEIRDGTQDRTKVVVLKATGWGATITVDLAVA